MARDDRAEMNVGDTWRVTDAERMARLRFGDVVDVSGDNQIYRVMWIGPVGLTGYRDLNIGAGIRLGPGGPSLNPFGFLVGDTLTLVEKADA